MKSDQQKAAEKALDLKRAGDARTDIPEHRTADEGMHPHPGPGNAPSGALDHAGAKPALSRSQGVRKSDKGG